MPGRKAGIAKVGGTWTVYRTERVQSPCHPSQHANLPRALGGSQLVRRGRWASQYTVEGVTGMCFPELCIETSFDEQNANDAPPTLNMVRCEEKVQVWFRRAVPFGTEWNPDPQ